MTESLLIPRGRVSKGLGFVAFSLIIIAPKLFVSYLLCESCVEAFYQLAIYSTVDKRKSNYDSLNN